MEFITYIIHENDENIRLDRWFKRHFPHVNHASLCKAIRKKDVRLEEKKVDVNTRLDVGQSLKICSFLVKTPEGEESLVKKPVFFPSSLLQQLKESIFYEDENIIALSKPAGIAVQGGSNILHHIDGFLSYLHEENEERPKLVHRLDKETSGVLIIARHGKAATIVSQAFHEHNVSKTYWALVEKVPLVKRGEINYPLHLGYVQGEEKVIVDDILGKNAKTFYHIRDQAGENCAWLELRPYTGRKHQLRVHCQAMGHPIIGDRKYGDISFLIDNKKPPLCLHAHRIEFMYGAKRYDLSAPLPRALKEIFTFFGF